MTLLIRTAQCVCYGDIDNDGDDNLVVLGNNEPNLLFENLGDGSCVDITSTSGIGSETNASTGCSMGDVNKDGLLDIAIANTFEDWTQQFAIFVEPYADNLHNRLFLTQGTMCVPMSV